MQRRDFVGALSATLGFPLIVRGRGGRIALPPDLAFASAGEAALAIRSKQISSVELTRLTLERVDRFNPGLNAIVNVLRDQAMARAREADAALARGTSWGPLHGVPVTVKESFGIAGVPATAGAPFLRNNIPTEDSVPVARLKAAGAILIGNTNVPFMLSDWQSYNAIYGSTNNPWDSTRTPGGSSGGTAAALAAGLGFLSLGSDIGGSIRVPAHFCGIYGHKPTVDVIPLRGHIPPMPGQVGASVVPLPVAGPMSRSAADLRLAMEILGGPEAPDNTAYRWRLPPARKTSLREFRIGVVLDDPACPLTDETRAVLSRAVDAIRRAGPQVTEGWPEGIKPREQFYTYVYLLGTYFADQLPDSLQDATRRLALSPDSSVQGAWNRAWTDPVKRILAQSAGRERTRMIWNRWFENHDVFLIPTAFMPAFPHDHSPATFARRLATPSGPRPYVDMAWWIGPASLNGLPATVAPVGVTASGLPVGIQIVGPYLEDATPIAFAEALAGVIGGFRNPPNY